jgi:hypothetical protein
MDIPRHEGLPEEVESALPAKAILVVTLGVAGAIQVGCPPTILKNFALPVKAVLVVTTCIRVVAV